MQLAGAANTITRQMSLPASSGSLAESPFNQRPWLVGGRKPENLKQYASSAKLKAKTGKQA
eukprot:340523-Pleurochrysis_carterae.AAC.3